MSISLVSSVEAAIATSIIGAGAATSILTG